VTILIISKSVGRESWLLAARSAQEKVE
jgi:hypothetical protein